jgi:hypothetical protein
MIAAIATMAKASAATNTQRNTSATSMPAARSLASIFANVASM